MDPREAVAVSRQRVEAVLDQLERVFGEVPVIDQCWDADAETYDDYVDRVARGTLGGAGA